jgi:hypothetical protein
MRRSTFILVLTIVLVLVAGVVVGRLWARLPVINPPADTHPNWVTKELGLTPDQQKQMDAIWAETRQKRAATFEQERNLGKQRDQAVLALLTDQQKAAYDKIQNDYHQQRTDLQKERERLVKAADEKSRALLSEEQQKRWDQMKASRPSHDHGPRGMNSANGPSTRPFRQHGDHPHEGF